MSRHKKNTILMVLLILGAALLIKTSWFHVSDHPPFYIDGNAVVMIDYNATEKDWKDAYLQWKAMRALDEYNAK
jgi:hypothetical protein